MNPLDQYANIQFLVQKDINDSIDKYADQAKFGVNPIPAHEHTGVDSSNISFTNLTEKFFFLPFMIPSSSSASSYGVVFIAPFKCILKGVQESHLVAGTVNGTMQVVKQIPGEGIGAGTNMLASPISLTSTANIPTSGILSDNIQDLNLEPGDRIKLTVSGTLTTLAGVCVTITLNY